MLLRRQNLVVISAESNTSYFWGDLYPSWARLNAIHFFPGQRQGTGVEPHYHDADELWLFLSGYGEVWVDGTSYEVTGNTAVYTPMGYVHRFQMFEDFSNIAAVTKVEGLGRITHVQPRNDGPAVPSDGVPEVVFGAKNHSFEECCPRRPLSQFRKVHTESDRVVLCSGAATSVEYWVSTHGGGVVKVDGLEARIDSGDVAIVREGTVREVVPDHDDAIAYACE